jgi:hypothetical protein
MPAALKEKLKLIFGAEVLARERLPFRNPLAFWDHRREFFPDREIPRESEVMSYSEARRRLSSSAALRSLAGAFSSRWVPMF